MINDASRELRADVDPANEGVVVVHLKKKRVRIMSPTGETVLFAERSWM